MKDLGHGRFHPSALAGRKDHDVSFSHLEVDRSG
jgi:hypothetical protein